MKRLSVHACGWPVLLAALFSACAATGPGRTPKTELPTPPPIRSAALDDGAKLQRIAFGSCYVPQYRTPEIWNTIAEADPDVMLLLGDNVYQSEEKSEPELLELREAYALLGRDEPFGALRAKTPLLVTWDDHDYGLNNAGGDWPVKYHSERLFEQVWNVRPGDPRRHRDGIYFARTVGPEGKRVQMILLDTRFFRSRFSTDENGANVPDRNPSRTMLGDAQWRWLEEELRRPADLRILASSIQVLTEGHRGESWRLLPRERQRLFELIRRTGAGGVVLISGDRHMGGIYTRSEGVPYPLTELTSSSLNARISEEREAQWDEPDERRSGELYFGTNFGWIGIDWKDRAVELELRDDAGEAVRTARLSLDHLRVDEAAPAPASERDELLDVEQARVAASTFGLPGNLGHLREELASRAQGKLVDGGMPAVVADAGANFAVRVSLQPVRLEACDGYAVESWAALSELTEVTRFPEGHPDRYHRVDLWSSAGHAIATKEDLEQKIVDSVDARVEAFVHALGESRGRAAGARAVTDAAAVTTDLPSSPAAVVEALARAFNEHDVDAMLSLVTDDVEWLSVQEDRVAVETRGKKALGDGMRGYFRNLPSARSTLEGLTSSGAFVTVRERAHWRGKNGDARSQAAIAVYEVREGLVRRVWYYPAE